MSQTHQTRYGNWEGLFKLQLKVEIDPELEFMRVPGISYVAGIGNTENPKVMFIGEAPGPMENAKGMPFCGPAGKIFKQLLFKNKFTSHEIYVTNVSKYMPVKPDTLSFRKPTPEEIALMARYLAEEIVLVNPEIICLLGNTAICTFYADQSVRKLRGNLIEYKINDKTSVKLFVTYHPSVVQYEPSKMTPLSKDFAKLASLIKK